MRRLSQPQWAGGVLHWLERRPDEGGRQVVVRAGPRGIEEVTGRDLNARSLVHEYGGGDYLATARESFVADGGAGIVRIGPGGVRRIAGSARGARYAEPRCSPDGRWLVAVEEESSGGATDNRLVGFDLEADRRVVLAEGHDFYASPRFSPDGATLAWLRWDAPAMPWDESVLERAEFEAGRTSAPRRIAGGEGVSIFQPEFSPAGRLVFVSDRSGWWNLYAADGGQVRPLCPLAADFGRAQWVFGMRTFAFVDEHRIACIRSQDGFDRLGVLELESGRLDDLAPELVDVQDVVCEGETLAFVAASADAAPAVCTLALGEGRCEPVRSAFAVDFDPALISAAEPIGFAVQGSRVHGFLYRPAHPGCTGPPTERPPLLVKLHGGPTAAASPGLDLAIQYWTSRGFAVVDVNYRGSSGFGRSYRDALRGRWGVVDVEDACAAVAFLGAARVIDPARAAIRGGSAGGFTVLACLAFRDVFAAGASYYGIGDLEALVRDTHKFEAHYLDGLVGPWPQRRDRYRERSALWHADGISCPVIFFQGLDDTVVPPSQAEAMVAALAKRGVAHEYVAFEGEAHGFRRAENVCRALEAELAFYGRVFGFEVDTSSSRSSAS